MSCLRMSTGTTQEPGQSIILSLGWLPLTISIIEFANMGEAEEAIQRLSGVDINNTPVKLEIAQDVSLCNDYSCASK